MIDRETQKQVSQGQFIQRFRDYGRMENFSLLGLKTLYNYLIECEQDSPHIHELDVIAICCEFSEYRSLKEASNDLGISRQELQRECAVIPLTGTGHVIIRNF